MADERSNFGLGGGYLRTSRFLNRVVNFVLATVLIVLSFPVLLLLFLIILARDGMPVIYRGVRLGLAKAPFTMYKFRTLAPNAEDIIGAQLLTAGHKLVTPFGKFLRDTRLDELPQLFNILKGDMDFVGPRPVRPLIYEKMCMNIPNYDKRFGVNPGLIGYSQLFTPHSAPKRMRTMIDNTLVKKKQLMLWDAGVIFLAGFMVLRTTIRQIGKHLHERLWRSMILHRYQEKRDLDRVALRGARVRFTVAGEGAEAQKGVARLIDINELAFLMRSSGRIVSPFPSCFRLEVLVKKGRGHEGIKIALCEGAPYREIDRGNSEYDYVVEYKPTSPLNYYRIDQYFLTKSVA